MSIKYHTQINPSWMHFCAVLLRYVILTRTVCSNITNVASFVRWNHFHCRPWLGDHTFIVFGIYVMTYYTYDNLIFLKVIHIMKHTWYAFLLTETFIANYHNALPFYHKRSQVLVSVQPNVPRRVSRFKMCCSDTIISCKRNLPCRWKVGLVTCQIKTPPVATYLK